MGVEPLDLVAPAGKDSSQMLIQDLAVLLAGVVKDHRNAAETIDRADDFHLHFVGGDGVSPFHDCVDAMRLTRDLGCTRESPDHVFDRDLPYYAGIGLSE